MLTGRITTVCCLILIFFLNTYCQAAPHYGANFSLAAIGTEPPSLHGYQLMLFYDPQIYKWRKFNVYFDGGISHFWVTNTSFYHSLNIYSFAPVIRYTFNKHGPFHPYLELSIGVAYLDKTHLDNRNLGIHFSFQDRIGIGTLLGHAEKLSVAVHAMHYSNAHFSDHNSGITVPIALDVGYRFN